MVDTPSPQPQPRRPGRPRGRKLIQRLDVRLTNEIAVRCRARFRGRGQLVSFIRGCIVTELDKPTESAGNDGAETT